MITVKFYIGQGRSYEADFSSLEEFQIAMNEDGYFIKYHNGKEGMITKKSLGTLFKIVKG